MKVEGFGPVTAGLEWNVKAVKKAFPDLDVDQFNDTAEGQVIRGIIVFGASGPEAPLIELTPEEKGTKLAEARITDETYKTADGFGIGSTYADVKAAGLPCVVSSDILGNNYAICSRPDAQNVQLVIPPVDTGDGLRTLDNGQAPPEQWFPGTNKVSAILWYPPGSAEVKRRWNPAAK